MAVEDRSLSEFPRALQVAEQALVMISNPDGLGGYDTNSAVLTEVGKAILSVMYTQQLGNVSVFDAIKNTRVLSGTTTPLANEGANGQLYVKYQTVSNVDTVIGMYFKKEGEWLEISLGGGGSWTDLTATLTSGNTSVTISDSAILTTSTIDIYTDTFGVNPTNVVVATGSITLTFEAQQSDVSVKVRVS